MPEIKQTPAQKAQAKLLAAVADIAGNDLVTHGDIHRVPTGLLGLNKGLGGGIPRCKFVEIHGPSNGGKTTTALELLRDIADANDETLKDPQGRRILFQDHEDALDIGYGERITGRKWGRVMTLAPHPKHPGQDLASVWAKFPILHFVPDTFERDYLLSRSLLRRKLLVASVLDSFAAMTPREAVFDFKKGKTKGTGTWVPKEEDDEERISALARLAGKYLPRLKKCVGYAESHFILLNHAKKKSIGHIGPAHMAPWETVGGENPKFYSDIRIRVTSKQSPIYARGQRIKMQIIRNKTAGGCNNLKFQYDTNGVDGIDRFGEAISLAIEGKLLKWVDAEGADCAASSKLRTHLKDEQDNFYTIDELRADLSVDHPLYAKIQEVAENKDYSKFPNDDDDDGW